MNINKNMHASLDRMLVRVFNSQYYLDTAPGDKFNSLVIEKCTKADTFEKLDKNWQTFLGACLYSAGMRPGSKPDYPLYSGLTDEQIKAIQSCIKKEDSDFTLEFTDADKAFLSAREKKIITNKDRYPDVDFLPNDEIFKIGDIGGTALLLVGTEQGSNAPIVAKSYESDSDEELFAIPLYELLNSQDPVNITEEI
ncbi:hypothetical protein [Nostoc sp. GT001]|uniref:hypothetical protein n=1 Tax=Nostoc sp. GT001 TaxID=3056647 RepID=UPI0025AAE3B3|nr:hypothetical protein [Nostoc sp. GT001]MDM9583124.1 hypothetical protein [Nostoc sp. GT001]